MGSVHSPMTLLSALRNSPFLIWVSTRNLVVLPPSCWVRLRGERRFLVVLSVIRAGDVCLRRSERQVAEEFPVTATFSVLGAPFQHSRSVLAGEGATYLPEGIQSLPRGYLGGVLIQTGREASTGELWFVHPHSGLSFRSRLPGRPGFFRPILGRQNQYLVGMDHDLAIVTIDPETHAATTEKFATIPSSIVAPSDTDIMINDGTADPTGRRLIFGCKDFHFGQNGKAGMLLQYSNGAIKLIRSPEVCPNGNVFLNHPSGCRLLHIETASQTLFQMPYDLDSGRIGTPSSLINFRDQSIVPPELFHSALMPDGMIGFEADGVDKIIVCIFDYRSESTVGRALQFAILGDRVLFDGVYEFPGSPRVTCPAIYRAGTGEPELYVTTADEGLGRSVEEHPHVGQIFHAPLAGVGPGFRMEYPTRFELPAPSAE